MNTIQSIAWLFPIVFMLHDFEEIIMTEAWQKKFCRERESLKGNAPFSDFISTASFSCAVAQEFVIFSAVTLACYLTDHYMAWFALYFACVLHFVIHLVLCLRFHHYVPGIVTSFLLFPIGVYTLRKGAVYMQADAMELLFCAAAGTVLLLLNVKLLHFLMPTFEQWVYGGKVKHAGKGS